MFRNRVNPQLGKHGRPQPHASGKPAELAQIRKQRRQEKSKKAAKSHYSTVRHHQQSYKPLGTFIEIILRLRGVVHVICTQHAAALHDKKSSHTPSQHHSSHYFFYHSGDEPKPLADYANAWQKNRF